MLLPSSAQIERQLLRCSSSGGVKCGGGSHPSRALLDSVALTATAVTGSLNQNTNAVLISGPTGHLDFNRPVIDIIGGGQATLTTKADKLRPRFSASPVDGTSTNWGL